MERKHSYRELDKRKFNGFVLYSLRDPDAAKQDIKFYTECSESKHYDKTRRMLITALQVAETLRREFYILGAQFKLRNYTPYTNEIKKELFKRGQATNNQLTLI